MALVALVVCATLVGTVLAAKLVGCALPILAAALAVALHLSGLLWINLSGGGVLSPGNIYRSEVVYDLSVSHFGLLTSNRLDIKRPAKVMVMGQ